MDVTIRSFPSRDREFVEYVDEAYARLPVPALPDALQAAVRARYPAAVVTVQADLARHGEGPIVWYAFRSAAVETPPVVRAGDRVRRERAWAILDDERRFLEVSRPLARITEVAPAQMIGHQLEEFSNPADPTIREDIALLWAEFMSAGALSSTIRFNYADGRPRELAYRIVANVDGDGRHRLTVRVLPSPER